MTEIEKTVKGLECCIGSIAEDCPDDCPYARQCLNGEPIYEPMFDALKLLKKQEPVKPKLVGVNTWICSKCGALLGWEDFSQSGLELVNYKYCPVCGRAVKWE